MFSFVLTFSLFDFCLKVNCFEKFECNPFSCFCARDEWRENTFFSLTKILTTFSFEKRLYKNKKLKFESGKLAWIQSWIRNKTFTYFEVWRGNNLFSFNKVRIISKIAYRVCTVEFLIKLEHVCLKNNGIHKCSELRTGALLAFLLTYFVF